MSGSVLASQSQQIDVFGARLPSEGPRILPLNLDFTATGAINIDFTLFFQQKRMTAIQGVYIRNWNNPNPLTISIAGTTVVYDVPSYADAVLQIWPNNLPKLTVTATQGVKVPIAFTNFPLAPVVIYNPANGTPVTIVGGATSPAITLTSRSVTTVAATSTPLMGANATRKYILIGAPQTADVWINPLGGTASIGGTDCFRIVAGGTYESASFVWNGAVNYYCATGSLELPAVEGS